VNSINMGTAGYAVKKTFRQAQLWREKGPRLHHLDIELTERCNNACMHCYINLPELDKQAASRELSTDQWKDILKQAADLGAFWVRFTGGEPLLREDFVELYLFTRRLGLEVTLFTNARRITPALADLFARVPPRNKIEITVYGMSPETYDAVACTQGAYVEFRQGIELLSERQIPFIVKSVLIPTNRADIEEFKSWAKTVNGDDKAPKTNVFLDLRARRDSPAKNRLIRGMRFTPEEAVALAARGGEAYRRDMAEFCAKFMRPPGDKLFACGAGEAGCVDAYGMYQMCMPLRHPDTVFDLKRGTLQEALTGFFPHLRELRTANPDYLDRCARCFLKGLCEQCPGKSWMEHGTLDTPVEYLCEIAHTQAHYLGLLEEGERAWTVDDWQARIRRFVDREKPAI
jgi:radical SAM protein with 4Fe4S-binding SPASM domain